MNKSYLKGLAELFFRNKGGELYKYRFFFQNKRAGTFFNHYLLQEAGKASGQPLFLPETTTLYNYLRRCSNLPDEDVNNDLLVIFHLYQVYKKHYPRKSEEGYYRFEQFYDLGKQLLSDFNDIDLHLAPTDLIFQNLDELGELTVNPSEYLEKEQIEALSRFVKILKDGNNPFNKEYSGFWAKLGSVYKELKLRLQQEQLTYTGMLMREIAERGEELGRDKINVFVGLNGLSMSEQKILKQFPEETLFYWDYDSDLLQNKFTEKSREVQKKFPEPTGELHYQREVHSKETKLKFISMPSRVAQSIYINQEIFKGIDWSSEEHKAKLLDPQVAIILPDEGQLIPLLTHLSLKPEQLNITMGFPIKELPLANRIMQLLSLQKRTYQRKNRWRRDELQEVVSMGLTKEQIDIDQLFSNFHPNKLYFDGAELLEQFGHHCPTLQMLLALGHETLLENTLNLFAQIPNQSPTEQDVLELLTEKLQQQMQSLQRFVQGGDEERSAILDFLTQYDLIITTIKRMRIPFEGEPLRGIQIMGMLEARSIDFETVIIMDAGEGILPARSRRIGLIPQSVRAGFGLPTYQWQDNIRAYNFFRLIGRAQEVYAIYDSRKSDRASGEPSRYLTLLTHIYGREAEQIEANLPVQPTDFSSVDFKLDREKILAYQNQLRPDGGKSLSPSSLIRYICCPRQFYFENILGLRQEEELSEILQKNDFGTFIHDSIHQLYADFEGKLVDRVQLQGISEEQIREVVTNIFCEALGLEPDHIEGYISAYIKTATDIVLKQIEMDMENSPFKYIGGEVSVDSLLEYEPNEFITLSGKLDRIDELGGKVRIIDYKTGKDKFTGDIEQSFDPLNKDTFRVLLQLLTYSYMMLHPREENQPVVKTSSSELLPLMMKPLEQRQDLFVNKKEPVCCYQKVEEMFEQLLKQTVAELMDPESPFETNNLKAHCDYCGGASICEDYKTKNY